MSGGSASSCWPVCRADGLQGIDSRHSILSYVLQHILLLSLWLSDVLCEVCIMVCFFSYCKDSWVGRTVFFSLLVRLRVVRCDSVSLNSCMVRLCLSLLILCT